MWCCGVAPFSAVSATFVTAFFLAWFLKKKEDNVKTIFYPSVLADISHHQIS